MNATDQQQLLQSIRTLGDLLDDLERTRIMNGNRIGSLERRFGSSVPHLEVIEHELEKIENEAKLELVRQWRKHPLAKWAKNINGVGEKSIARLIAHISEPAVAITGEFHSLPDGDREWVATGSRPRLVSELWSYCGLGDPARKRRKGMTQEEAMAMGNPAAKKQCWLIGEAFVKSTKGPYRPVYDAARAKYADRVHATACVRCGPSGKPAAPGSPWSLKHQHEAAKRYAVKTFLKDLWVASQGAIESPPTDAGNP